MTEKKISIIAIVIATFALLTDGLQFYVSYSETRPHKIERLISQRSGIDKVVIHNVGSKSVLLNRKDVESFDVYQFAFDNGAFLNERDEYLKTIETYPDERWVTFLELDDVMPHALVHDQREGIKVKFGEDAFGILYDVLSKQKDTTGNFSKYRSFKYGENDSYPWSGSPPAFPPLENSELKCRIQIEGSDETSLIEFYANIFLQGNYETFLNMEESIENQSEGFSKSAQEMFALESYASKRGNIGVE